MRLWFKKPPPEPAPEPTYFTGGWACDDFHVSADHNGGVCLYCGRLVKPAVVTYRYLLGVKFTTGFVRWIE